MGRLSKRMLLRFLAQGAALAALGACSIGPDYKKPDPPQITTYTQEKPLAVIGGSQARGDAAQRLETNMQLTADWAHLFHSTDLDNTVRMAVAGNPDLASARASLREAHEAVIAAEGALLPQVDANAGVSHQKASFVEFGENQSVPSFNLYSLGATVGYPLDIFGANSDAVLEGTALEDMQRAEVAAAYISLTGSVVTEAIQIAESREELLDIKEIIAADQKNLDLLQDGVRAGITAQQGPEVLSAESQIAADNNLLPPVLQRLDVARHALASLTGQAPSEWSPPNFDFDNIRLPDTLPVSMPSLLVRQRPDILAAEARVKAANSAVDIATANLFPNLTLTAAYTFNGLSPSDLFSPVGLVSSVAGQLMVPVFHGGTLQAEERGAEAAYDVAVAQYQSTVLSSFRQVADTLRALQHDAELTNGQHLAVEAAKKSLDSARKNLSAGTAGYLQVLDSTRQFRGAELGYLQALAQRYQDAAALFVAMGGGWWTEPSLEKPADTAS